MREALEILDARRADFAYEGEMHVDAALDPELRARIFPNRAAGGGQRAGLRQHRCGSGRAQHPQDEGGGLEVGPILMGMGNRAHIVTPAITARGLAEHVGARRHAGGAITADGRQACGLRQHAICGQSHLIAQPRRAAPLPR
jgi:hypothetical protein